MSNILPRSFYLRADVVTIARELLGMVLVTGSKKERTSGIITETEAYAGPQDKASHAYGGKRTARNEPMYAQGGTAYVYLCYGIHHLFNIVTNEKEIPHAVLVRGVQPLEGIGIMRARRGVKHFNTTGPGMLSTALGIRTSLSGTDLLAGPVWIEDHGIRIEDAQVIVAPRIGVDYAGADAMLPYRFLVAPSQRHSLTPL